MKFGYGDYYIDVTTEDVASIHKLSKEMFARLFVPKNKPLEIGIIIAIKTENNKEKIRLENDLIAGLNEYLDKSKLSNRFNIINYPESISSKIINSETAKLYLNRSRAHLIVFGSLAERNINGENNYIFKLQGLVRHVPIKGSVKRRLAEDFSTSLPNKLVFPETKELLGFELTKDLLGYVIKFISGSAAQVSGDKNISYKLFKELSSELPIIQKVNGVENPIVTEIIKRNRFRLIGSLVLKIEDLYNIYSLKRKDDAIFETESILNELRIIDPDNIYGSLAYALLLFKKLNTDGAISELESTLPKVNNNDIALWRYNLGFLYAYIGKIKEALEFYRKASYGIIDPGVINDLEIFISEEISKNPQLIQLIFFRGLINYKAKPDYVLAKKDFETFVNNIDSKKYPDIVGLAKKYLSEIPY
ncbi:MAG: tetratricopeptide repeat protein [Patescibacteria group bacterium]